MLSCICNRNGDVVDIKFSHKKIEMSFLTENNKNTIIDDPA